MWNKSKWSTIYTAICTEAKPWKRDEEFLCFLTAQSRTGTRQHSARWTGFFFSCLRTNCRRFQWWGYWRNFIYSIWCYMLIASQIKNNVKFVTSCSCNRFFQCPEILSETLRLLLDPAGWETKAVNKSQRCHLSTRCRDQVMKFLLPMRCCLCFHRRWWRWAVLRSCSWASDSGNVGMWGSTVQTRTRGEDFLKSSSLFFSFTWAFSK